MGPRITSRALSQTQSGKAESEFGTLENWRGRWGLVVFWSEVGNPMRHQK